LRIREESPLAEKIRVLFAIGQMSGGGSQRQLIGILQRLDRSRFAPQLYVVTAGGEFLSEVPPDVPVRVFSERHQSSPWLYPGHAHRARVCDLARVLDDQQIDVVYDRTYHMTLITSGATQRRPTPRISVIVTDPARDFETNVERFRFAKRLLLRRAYQTADRVVAVSEGVRSAAIAHYRLAAEKTLTIHNFFDIERVDRQMQESLPVGEARSPGERFELVAAGRLHPQKGLSYLLEAVRILVQERGRPQIHLRILGDGPLRAALAAFIAEHRLDRHVTLAGFRENPLPYFRQADLFCLSSLYEGMPNALVEAMLCRVPVLATDCPSGPREVLDGGRLGWLVPPADAAALAGAIDDAIANLDRWRALTPAARAHIEESFSPRAGIARLESLLSTLAPRGPVK
jgi:glycosyltransferase involved in cell wall biosynthesis